MKRSYGDAQPLVTRTGSGGDIRKWRRILMLLLLLILASALGLAYPLLVHGASWFHVGWQSPWWLLGLVLMPWALFRGTWGVDRRSPRLQLGTLLPFVDGPVGFRIWFRDTPGVLRAVGLSLLIIAMARPIHAVSPQTSEEEGIDMVVVLDLSGSMQAVMEVPEDLLRFATRRDRGILPTRLDAAKAVIRDFISRRKTDRIGVVVFGADAFVLSPPTLDYHLLDTLVSKMELQLIDGTATTIGDAIGVAVARLRRSDAESRAVILLTDGDNRGGRLSPDYAAHLANVVGVKLYTVQIGTGDVSHVQDGFDLFGQPRLREIPYPTNPKLLKELADKTGGEMYVASDAKSLRASFHDVLDRLEKTRFEGSVATYKELFGLLLLPGVLFLALDAFARSLILRRFP